MKELDKKAYSISELSNVVSLGRTKLYEEIKEGRLKTRKVGRRTLITAQDADAWLNSLSDGRA